MTSLSFMQCCRLLAVDPKTLRQWLAQAQMSLHVHPTNARIKCLTGEQVNVLANLHDRVLLHPSDASDAEPMLCGTHSQAPAMAGTGTDLHVRLGQLETQVATLQAQLTDLALQLLKERQGHSDTQMPTLHTQHLSMQEHALALPAPCDPSQLVMPALACHPTERRNRLIPLIEYGACGQYVLICPQEGELHLAPDSAEWFAWLKSLSSFRFVGKFGHFSARRGYNRRPNRSWYAQRTIHQRYHSKYIGVSEDVTIDRLEHIAADVQLYLK